jgi:hypothetical protein
MQPNEDNDIAEIARALVGNFKERQKAKWQNEDPYFFRQVACHILAHVFLQTYPLTGFRAWLITPVNKDHKRGVHVFVAGGDNAFDSLGYADRHKLIADYFAKQKQGHRDWEGAVHELPSDTNLIGDDFCSKHGLALLKKFPADPLARAREFLKKFPSPPKTCSS